MPHRSVLDQQPSMGDHKIIQKPLKSKNKRNLKWFIRKWFPSRFAKSDENPPVRTERRRTEMIIFRDGYSEIFGN